MRFAASSALLALPLLGATAAADEGGLFNQYRAQFQGFVSNLGFGSVGGDNAPSAAGAAAAGSGKTGAAGGSSSTTTEVRPLHYLTMSTWKDTLYSPVQPGATVPEEWWVLLTGRNKTCYGRCSIIESAFIAAAPKLSSIPNGPHVGIINCDDEQVLCNSWSATPGYIYVFEMLPQPAKTDMYYKRLNLTTTTSETITDLYARKSKDEFTLYEGNWHPLDSFLAVQGLAHIFGYALYAFGLVPNWLFMIGISFLSRTMMSRRAGPPRPRGGNLPAAQ